MTTELWIDIAHPTPERLQGLGLHPLIIDDILKGGQRTKIERYESGVFFVFYALSYHGRNKQKLHSVPIYLFVTTTQMLTIHHGELEVIGDARQRWDSMNGLQSVSVAGLLHVVLDTIVDSYFPMLDHIGDLVETLETEMLVGAQAHQLREIVHLKRMLLTIRRQIAPAREALNALLRGDLLVLDAAAFTHMQDVYDHVLRIVDAIDLHRDLLATVLDVHLSVQSNRLNQVMKVLTMASIILMVNSLVAGIYGMNFSVMPELQWTWGYPFALAVMGVASAVLLWFFRRQGWWGED